MEIRKFLNPKILKWAVLSCSVIGLVYMLSDVIILLIIALINPANMSGVAFSTYKAIISDGLFSVSAFSSLFALSLQISLGFVFYAFSFAFAALIDIADELENTI